MMPTHQHSRQTEAPNKTRLNELLTTPMATPGRQMSPRDDAFANGLGLNITNFNAKPTPGGPEPGVKDRSHSSIPQRPKQEQSFSAFDSRLIQEETKFPQVNKVSNDVFATQSGALEN